MSTERTGAGLEIEEALAEFLAPVRGATSFPRRIVALRKRLNLSRQKFADRFGPDGQAVQDQEKGRRAPDWTTRVPLTEFDSGPETITRILAPPAD